MNDNPGAGEESAEGTAKWEQLSSMERRVLGVLGEKAKTTPEQYPLSLNALTNGCNQKSNRHPQMSLEQHQVEDALEKLRKIGAASEVQGASRVSKYRHYLYDWLGVNKTELAVMIELLLRGEQTMGDLRGRAARMEPIASIGELKPIVAGLIEKGLVQSLTPEGRGQVVTHTLYLDREMEKVQLRAAELASATTGAAAAPASSASSGTTDSRNAAANEFSELRQEVRDLRETVEKLEREINDIWENIR